MKVVIDTNVVVSAVLRDRDPEAVIRFVTAQANWQWSASSHILTENNEVLRRPKFGLPIEVLEEWSNLFSTFITAQDVTLNVDFPRDQKDAKFLACALAVEADYFITGDQDFTEASKLVTTTICSVRQFKQLIIDTTK